METKDVIFGLRTKKGLSQDELAAKVMDSSEHRDLKVLVKGVPDRWLREPRNNQHGKIGCGYSI